MIRPESSSKNAGNRGSSRSPGTEVVAVDVPWTNNRPQRRIPYEVFGTLYKLMYSFIHGYTVVEKVVLASQGQS
jgi:hypothetical protein